MRSRLLRASAACLLLQACSSFGPPPIAVPAPSDIATFAATGMEPLSGLSAQTIINNGFALVDEQCDVFFTALQKERNVTAFSGAELAALGGLAVSTLTLLHAGLVPAGITGGAIGFAATTTLNYGQFALLTQYNAELQDLVHASQQQFKSQLQQNQSSPLTPPQAYAVVLNYAFLCSLPGIDSLARQALQKQTQNLNSSTTPTPLTTQQIAAIGTINTALGIRNYPLTGDEAAALLVYWTMKGSAASSDNVRAQLSSDQLKAIFSNPTSAKGTALTLTNEAAFNSAMALLVQYEAIYPQLLQIVAQQLQSVSSGKPASHSMMIYPLPEEMIPGPSLGVIIPQIQMR